MQGIDFSISPPPEIDHRVLTATVRRAEELGCTALRVSDHPGTSPSPFVVLAHAAASTEKLRLDTYVLNAGLRQPLQLAADVATLDVLSAGRVTLGLGAGHTPAEWTMTGSTRPVAADRIDKLARVADATRRLLAGEVVDDDAIGLAGAALAQPRPVQQPVPLLIGGSNPALIGLALDRADVISLSGLGRTLPDGHRHEARWSSDDMRTLADRLDRRRPDQLIDALVQHAKVTDRREAEAERIAENLTGATAEDVLGCPFVLLGTLDQIADELDQHRRRFGITSYCIRHAAMEDLAPLLTG